MSNISPDLTGQTLGNWTLLRLIGEGGFGAVYEAQHTSIEGRRAAVKLLHPHLAFHKDIKRRFISEASIASQADHENIVQVFDGGVSAEGTCFIAMELLKGRSLARCLQVEKRLDVARTLSIGIQVSSALEAAHSLGVVHRDLKPDNIFIVPRKTNSNFIKVLDFGIAKLQSQEAKTTTGTLLGTPLYMSPEQWQTLPDIDGRSDLYTLGVILYECLTGEPPYDGETTYALMMAHIQKDIPSPARIVPIPADLNRLIRRLLAKKREQRPASAREVTSELRRMANLPEDVTEGTADEFSPTLVAQHSPTAGARSLSIGQQVGQLVRAALSWPRLVIFAVASLVALSTCLLLWRQPRLQYGSTSEGKSGAIVPVSEGSSGATRTTVGPVQQPVNQQAAAVADRPQSAGSTFGHKSESATPTPKLRHHPKTTRTTSLPKNSAPGSLRSPNTGKNADSDFYRVPVLR